jgi:hypothetical protein
MTAESLTLALGGTFRGNRGVAKCPSHREKTPSLSITEREGTLLVYCFGGCQQPALISALRARGLWPEREPTTNRQLSPADRRRLAREAAQQRAAKARAELWKRGRVAGLEVLKAWAFEDDDLDILAAAASELWALQRASGAALVDLWQAALRADPESAAECEKWAEEDTAFSAALTGVAVSIIAEAEQLEPHYQPPQDETPEAA